MAQENALNFQKQILMKNFFFGDFIGS